MRCCGRFLVPTSRTPGPSVLVGDEPPEGLGDAPLAEPTHSRVGLGHEVRRGPPRPAAAAGHLTPEGAEKPLRSGAVAAHALPGRAPGEVVAPAGPARPGRWQWALRSEWTAVRAPGASVSQARSSAESESPAVGLGPTDQAAGLLPRRSTAGLRQHLPAGAGGSVTSVARSSLGAAAERS